MNDKPESRNFADAQSDETRYWRLLLPVEVEVMGATQS
jgi:hypothetical protein